MANLGDISQIELPNGDTANFKDSTARESLVPTVGSSDNEKVLTAVYSGGSGSYEWATADDRVYYCTCSTSASTAKKVVTTTQDFKLTTGCIIAVKFNNANTASSVQLNVNNTGDKTIAYAASNPYTGTDKVVTGYGASHINYYIYNGTNWRWGGCTAPRVPDASSATPQPLGTAAAGSSTDYSRADHVHAMPANATTSAAGLMSADDKKELIELVDNGAKNELLLTLDEFKSQNTSGTWSGDAYTINGITFTVNDDMTVTVNGTLTGERALFRLFFDRPNIWGGKFLTGCPSGGSVYDYGINFEQSVSPWSSIAQDYGNGNIISNNTSTNIYGYIVIKKSVSNLTFKPMICSKAAWDVSQKYVPYVLKPLYRTEILSVNITSLTWTASGQGMYYSSEISLASIQTILGWCMVEINGLKPENWFIPSQSTTGLGKFRLLTGSNNFYSGANIRIRLFGSTESLT